MSGRRAALEALPYVRLAFPRRLASSTGLGGQTSEAIRSGRGGRAAAARGHSDGCASGRPRASATAEASAACAALAAGVVLLPGVLWALHGRAERRDRAERVPIPQALLATGAFVDDRLRLRAAGPKGTGLFVATPAARGTELIRIPSSCVLSGARARDILGTDLEPDVALCALLAEARREAEKGNDILGLLDYLLALPASVPSLPLFFTDAELERELGGTVLQPATHFILARSQEERQAALTALGDALSALWDEKRWLWARAMLLTRGGPNFQLAWGRDDGVAEENQGLAIVPVVDFANCDSDPTAECKPGGDGSIRLVARRDLAAGSEVTISYGDQSQEQMLFTFGFAAVGAPLAVTSPLSLFSGESKVKDALLRLLALDSDGRAGLQWPALRAQLRLSADEAVDTWELRAASNILHMSEEGLRDLAKTVGATGQLPKELGGHLTPDARTSLMSLLHDWSQLLERGRQRRGRDVRFEAARAYLGECRRLVHEAIQQLEADSDAPLTLGRSP